MKKQELTQGETGFCIEEGLSLKSISMHSLYFYIVILRWDKIK